MIKVVYKDGLYEEYSQANDYSFEDDENNRVNIVKREFDEDGDFDSDEDDVIATINFNEARSIAII